MNRAVCVAGLVALMAGCASVPTRDRRAEVSEALRRRTGHPLGPVAPAAGPTLADPIDENGAVAFALWNNPDLQEAMAELGLRRADVVEAGLLTNPVFSLLFPLGQKQLEFLLRVPMEAFWLRPRRIAVAETEYDRVAARLVEDGLDLVRDVRAAFGRWGLAVRRRKAAANRVALRREVAALFEERFRRGDVSELEVMRAKVAARRAAAEAQRREHETALAVIEVRALLGLAGDPRPLPLVDEAREEEPVTASLEDLHADARAARPDLRAAELGVEAAGRRAGLARSEVLRWAVSLDANEKDTGGLELGPGLDVTLPLFHRNAGARAKAKAELEQAQRHYVAVRHAVARDVAGAHGRLLEAKQTLALWRGEIVPSLLEASGRAERAFAHGETSRLPVLQAALDLIDARAREAEAESAVRVARVELERSVGHRLQKQRK